MSLRHAPVLLLLAALALAASLPTAAAVRVLVISGLGGNDDYEQRFATLGRDAAQASLSVAGDASHVQHLSGAAATAAAVEKALSDLATQLAAGDQAIIVLIGHGSHDGSEYRFNLPGPDLTGSRIATLLDRLPAGAPQLVVNATSASGAVARSWQRPHRVVITATRSAGERNAPRYATYWVEALQNAAADRDKDENVTAVEAHEYAARQVAESYKSDAAIATEHSQLQGTAADRFVVARLGRGARYASDSVMQALRAEQRAGEQRLGEVRAQRATLDADRYYALLEPVMQDIARLDQRIDAREQQLGAGATGVAR